MSFNNWLDVYAAHSLVTGLASPAAVIVKHNNPSGAAVTASLAKAYELAFECDTVSAFGGIVAFNQEAGEDAASAMGEVFTEVVVAPGFTDAALDAFGARRNLRVVQVPEPVGGGLDIRPLPGGALVQDRDVANETRDQMEVVSAREPSAAEWRRPATSVRRRSRRSPRPWRTRWHSISRAPQRSRRSRGLATRPRWAPGPRRPPSGPGSPARP